MGLWPGAETGQISRNTSPHANPRHHAPILMFENMAMINEIARYRERNVNGRGVGLAGTLTPVRNAQTGAIGMDKRHAIHENTLGEDLARHICLVDFG